jgi:pteridine reductase
MSTKTAIITGAARRIGAAIARELHRTGMDVIVHYHHSADEAHALVQQLNAERPGSAHALAANLAGTDACQAFIEKALTINKQLDVLINNAAVFYPTPLTELDDAVWNEFININLKAPLFLSRAAAPGLAQTSGCIINIADIHAERPLKNYPLYSISKAGLIMLTRSLARELGPLIRVNAIAPGAILWPEDLSSETRKKILARTVLKRLGKVEDLTGAIRYLVEDANYTTGEVLVIDGGRTLYS